MRVLSLCSGYGGLELALSQALPNSDLNLIAVCDSYGPSRTVLEAHWPKAVQFKDVHDPALEGLQADVATFGFPCQDLSRAGHGGGVARQPERLVFQVRRNRAPVRRQSARHRECASGPQVSEGD